jgi:hypothetical protein
VLSVLLPRDVLVKLNTLFFMKAKHIVIVQFEVTVWSAWCRCNQVSHPVAASGESGREDLDDAPPKPMCTAQ